MHEGRGSDARPFSLAAAIAAFLAIECVCARASKTSTSIANTTKHTVKQAQVRPRADCGSDTHIESKKAGGSSGCRFVERERERERHTCSFVINYFSLRLVIDKLML